MLALLLLLAFQVSPELRQHIDAGLKAKSAGDLDRAVREFKRVVELAPNLAASHVNLGAVLFDRKDYAAAVPSLKRALELNPELPGAAHMLGAALLAQGFASESITWLQKSGSDDLLGVALLEAGRTREAVDRLESALLKRPDDQDLLYYLSRAHGTLSRDLADRVRDAGPTAPRAQQLIGEAMAAARNPELAEKHFRAALALRPDMRGIHQAIGELLLESGDYAKAEAEFRAEARLAPGAAVTAYKLGVVLLNLGRVQDAIAELRRANTLQPGMPETLLELARALAAGDDAVKAEPLLLEVLKMEGESALAESAHFQLAEIYRKLGRTADAQREMKRFKELRDKR